MRFVISQIVQAPIDRVKEFYSDVKNLKRVSPPFPRMTIVGDDTRVEPGREFAIMLDFLLFELTWNSTIESVVPGEYFVDTFRGSVVKHWRHVHRYEPHDEGALLTDEIECEVAPLLKPFAWLGIRALFGFRKRAFARAFS